MHKFRFFPLKTLAPQKVAGPVRRDRLLKSLKNALNIGKTSGEHDIYLVSYKNCYPIIKELGRLREFTFRQVGEGTGQKRDLDSFDKDYQHIVLWNKTHQEIVGSYRLVHAGSLIRTKGITSLYTSSLYDFSENMRPILDQGVELGRSFIHPKYWGKYSLDYLWQGIGAFLQHYPSVRYLIGPVSISSDHPKGLIRELTYYLSKYYGCNEFSVVPYIPYELIRDESAEFETKYHGLDRLAAMDLLQNSFKTQHCKIPILIKQYLSLYEEGGIKLLALSRDPKFGNCVDALLVGDLHYLKAKKRERYIHYFEKDH